MGLFNRRKSHEYQGFAKYADEYNLAAPSPAAERLQRAQSLSSASQAAAAALQLHQKTPVSSAPKPARPGTYRPSPRSNSLGGYGRTALMNLYTYTPQASYSTGPLRLAQAPRTLSLRSNSLSNSVRLGPRRSFVPRSVFPEEDEEAATDADLVVTTKTTKVLDAQGRTCSITTETVRQMADGLNIIETKTTNISRSNSRANSLQAPPQEPPLANAYSLNKIDEDLQDFDYTYLDHAPPRANRADDLTASPRSRLAENAPREPPHVSPERQDLRAGSMTSTQSSRRPKSILKSSSSAVNAAAAVAASVAPDTGNGAMHTGPAFDASASPEHRRQHMRSASLRLQPAPKLEPTHRLNSMASGGTSIKFLDKVETIPYTYTENYQEIANEEKYKKEQALQNNLDLYNKAMQVATEKVYGSPRSDGARIPDTAEHDIPKPEEIQLFAEKKSAKKLKSDEKRSRVEASGVSKNYVYTNHHTDFPVRSLRNTGDDHHTSRKERAKEEKRRFKEEEKRHAELLKAAEKQKRQEEREAKKREKTHFSLFKRNRRHSSVGGASLGSSEAKSSISSEQTLPSTKPENNPALTEAEPPVTNTVIQEEPSYSNLNDNDGISGVLASVQGSSEQPTHGLELHAPEADKIPIISDSELVDDTGSGKMIEVPTLPAQLENFQLFDDEDDEFVDVPDNLGDDSDKRISGIPLLNHDKADGLEKDDDLENANEKSATGESLALNDPVRSVSPEIPERGDLTNQPASILPSDGIDTSKVSKLGHGHSTLTQSATSAKTLAEELPTLVSRADGMPEVLTKSCHQISQHRDTNRLKETPVHSPKDGNKVLSGNEPSVADYGDKKASLENPVVLDQAPESFVLLRQDPKTDIQVLRLQDNQGSVEISSGSIVDLGEQHVRAREANSPSLVPSVQAALAKTGDKSLSTDLKLNTKKKGGRFKKVIEKYFINTYSR
ncbi:hypothetical protein METBIDRAFT_81129 [Metschnikowia bicuspidata var. bicuspidata NRRL YB-4993]|uniref:Uncharacterized protein n=1 Tax=Metschnikowia bicuspidata var. bicuspidata NRRL YB-4993 TaxID=869754 RepID=A0A1A0HI90_9ASCO|nr:hypothetical protein METBIDRAFT_81129 [Metschnikowia bicuspidata var. bicuspidata NRRL YB-4993]OBA23716.1 hypothetical protein METBIDRAFT_81129 [Metschnikowia bicuspidata var. bicuspidata NRRL YB-4993]